MRLLGIPGESYRVGRCRCGARLRLSRSPGVTECVPCGSAYHNLTGEAATTWLLVELGHTQEVIGR